MNGTMHLITIYTASLKVGLMVSGQRNIGQPGRPWYEGCMVFQVLDMLQKSAKFLQKPLQSLSIYCMTI